MHISKNTIKIVLIAALALGIIWLIIEIAPLLIGALIFIPWLGAALAAGANVK